MRRWPILAGFSLVFAVAVGSSRPTTSMPDAVRIPVVEPHPGGIPAAPALFRHATHGQLSCYACHPGVFPRYRVGFTHRQMNAGEFCGGCHDGRGAFSIAKAPCERCHVPE